MRKYRTNEGKIMLPIKTVLPLFGNIMINFKTVGSMKNSDLFRFSFNTAFIQKSNVIVGTRWQISPEKLHKDHKKFTEHFQIIIEFEDYC